jgi:hypothetical protein
MTRKAQLILVCEDSQHEAFARRLLEKDGWNTRKLRVVKSPRGRGSGAYFVCEQYVQELQAYRANRHRVTERLLVLIDGDDKGVAGRLAGLEHMCKAAGLEPRQDDEKVAIITPTWNIETWIEYLRGTEVDETKEDYPRLERARECQAQVNLLSEMCQQGELRQPAPPSLVAACEEYRIRVL